MSRSNVSRNILGSQVFNIGILCFACLGVVVTTHYFPTLFVYPYLKWSGWQSVTHFWPLFAWALVASIVFGQPFRNRESWGEKFSTLGYGMLTSLLAGVWEEIGYRFAFIMYAMLGIMCANFIFGFGGGWVLAIVFGICAFVLLLKREWLLVIFAFAGVALSLWFAQHANLVYWFYEHIMVPVVHYTSFTLFDPVLYNGHDKLFLFGALAANVWFRDGHKYQGLIGLVNSWYGGLVFLYATVTYGLMTAIIIHVVYDLLFDLTRFVLTRTK